MDITTGWSSHNNNPLIYKHFNCFFTLKYRDFLSFSAIITLSNPHGIAGLFLSQEAFPEKHALVWLLVWETISQVKKEV
jgi:hypothetical protein